MNTIFYQGKIWNYLGISAGMYVFAEDGDVSHTAEFTPGMFDMMTAVGLIRAASYADTDSIKYREEA